MFRYLLPTVVVLCLLIMLAHVGTALAEDGADEDAAVQTLRAGGDTAVFAAGICPADAAVDERRAHCSECPDEAPLQQGRMAVRRVFQGDFAGDGTRRAVVALNGCASSYAEGHATALFEKRDGRWEKTDYHQGMNTSMCRLFDLDGLHTLVCLDRQFRNSGSKTDIFAFSPGADGWSITDLHQTFDHSGDCDGDDEITRRLISIHTGVFTDDGDPMIGLLIESRNRTPNADEPEGCSDYDVEASHKLMVFRPADDGMETVEFDDPCAHPERARVLREGGGQC